MIYSVTVVRHEDDGSTEELVAEMITPHQAIDFMLMIANMDTKVFAFAPAVQEDEDGSTPDMSTSGESNQDDDEDDGPKPVVSQEIEGTATGWDKDRAKLEIKLGHMKPKQIAEECGTTVGNIYQLKSQMKKDGELDEKVDSNDPPVAEVLQNRITDMVNSGMEYQEIYNKMHDSMSEREIQEAFSYAQKNLK